MEKNKILFNKFPKIELHAHLNGSVSVATLQELLEIDPHLVSEDDLTKFHTLRENMNNFGNKTTEEILDECFFLFKIIHQIVVTKEALEFITKSVIEDFAADNVIYLEIRTTPKKTPYMSKKEYLKTFLAQVDKSNQDLDIQSRAIISIDRSKSLKEARENLRLAQHFREKFPNLVVGIDFSGNPNEGNFSDFLPILKHARNLGFKITVHCGEVLNEKEVDNILNFSPERLGHCLFVSSEQMKKIRKQNIPVEVCPSSNMITLGLKDLSQHPGLNTWLQTNQNITICTDDSGIMNTALSQETNLVLDAFHINFDTLLNIVFNSVNFAFCNVKTKHQILQKLVQWKKATVSRM
eukprot:maker-scaffold_33-snap-gene-3.72-mRNA-1 protein AED:0.26 eAED:0.26 QI:179/1/1/1/1/1/2/711/351